MEKKTYYYLIMGRQVGKGEEDDGRINYFLFKNGEWVPDSEHVILDRLVGYDPSEPEDSPYRMGNTDIMDEIETISEEEANRIVGRET